MEQYLVYFDISLDTFFIIEVDSCYHFENLGTKNWIDLSIISKNILYNLESKGCIQRINTKVYIWNDFIQ